MRLLLLFALLLAAVPAAARSRAVRPLSGIPHPRSVLWIGAHPDDEAVAAPLLAAWCRDEHARCGFFVLTRGDLGNCLKAGGCVPDVATVRASEAGAASQYFGADSITLNLPDGGGINPPNWPADITATVARYIDAFDPELILTFDPRHGTTCHPDHRATAAIVLNAVNSSQRRVYLLETRLRISADPLSIHFDSASPAADRFNGDWNAIIEDVQRHPSQFDERWIAAIRNVPLSERFVFIAPAESILEQPVATCP